MWPSLLIFDFDGVIADSETLACGIAAAYATELGAPMSAADGLRLFMGKRTADVAASIVERGGVVPDSFVAELQKRTLSAFATSLKPVPGVADFLGAHRHIPCCVASSSSHARLAASLAKLDLSRWFGGRVFSAEDVVRGKPFPDLFLKAAKVLNSAPTETLVIEDSVGGVTAAVSAGMQVVGLLAGSHVGVDHGDKLQGAGATAVARTYGDLSDWIGRRSMRRPP